MAFLLLAGLFALVGGGHAQDTSGPKNKRTFYVVKHGDVKELAHTLGKHFRGDAEVQVLPDALGNCLLISAAPSVFEEVAKLLEQLDRRPQLVSVEVLIAEVAPKKGESGRELDEKEFTGPGKEVLDKLASLQKSGAISSLKRLQLTAVENQPVSVTVGESKPTVAAVTTTGTGIKARSIVYRNTGTQARVTARMAAENTIAIDLHVNDSRLRVPEDGIEIGKDENAAPIRATEVVIASLNSNLNVRSGQAVAAQGVRTDSKSGKEQTVIVVTANVLEPGAKGAK
jgi:type II secretory pathway component GspD/PulD (secretin)